MRVCKTFEDPSLWWTIGSSFYIHCGYILLWLAQELQTRDCQVLAKKKNKLQLLQIYAYQSLIKPQPVEIQPRQY